MCVLVYMYVCSFAYVCLYKRLFVRVQRLIYVCIFVDLHECMFHKCMGILLIVNVYSVCIPSCMYVRMYYIYPWMHVYMDMVKWKTVCTYTGLFLSDRENNATKPLQLGAPYFRVVTIQRNSKKIREKRKKTEKRKETERTKRRLK